jgi:hypothetical protein
VSRARSESALTRNVVWYVQPAGKTKLSDVRAVNGTREGDPAPLHKPTFLRKRAAMEKSPKLLSGGKLSLLPEAMRESMNV